MANKKQKAKAKKFRNDPGPFPDFFETDNFTKKESKLVTTAVSKPVENKSKKSTKAICDVTGNNVSNVDIVDDKWVSPVQNLFLRLVSAVYLVAFFSFYYQIRGLYGNNGILPLKYLLNERAGSVSESKLLDNLHDLAPSLVWYFSANFGLPLTAALEVCALLGIFISLLQLLRDGFRGPIMYYFLFLLYFSCVNVGQTFYYFQWDAFLLEVGALTILISIRFTNKGSRSYLNRLRPHPTLVLWTVRWLLFKFMFSSGIVKFTARCPVWWSLRALDIHFESQPLPTPYAWYAHQIPKNWLHLAVIIHFVIEIAIPFFFFTFFKTFKLFSFVSQVFLQVAILFTGNYNFFNLLTIALCFTLLDDDLFNKEKRSKMKFFKFEIPLFGIVLGILAYYTVHYFNISFTGTNFWQGPSSQVNFTYDQFNSFVTNMVSVAMVLGVISFLSAAGYAIYQIFYGSMMGKIIHCMTTLFYILICFLILALSMVPLAELDTKGINMRALPHQLKEMYQVAQENHFMSSYGLFRTMTGDGGRPELIIEGSNNPNDTQQWRPYYFKYKPVDLYESPKFLIPYQPRLDWQMWFAALDSYQKNPWLIHLCYRLLTGESDVLDLLDRKRLPFDTPPKFLRISRYLYQFTDSRKDNAWWRKQSNRHDYLPMVTKETLESALKLHQIRTPAIFNQKSPQLERILDSLRLNIMAIAQYIPPIAILQLILVYLFKM